MDSAWAQRYALSHYGKGDLKQLDSEQWKRLHNAWRQNLYRERTLRERLALKRLREVCREQQLDVDSAIEVLAVYLGARDDSIRRKVRAAMAFKNREADGD